jgi:hypothetical protein
MISLTSTADSEEEKTDSGDYYAYSNGHVSLATLCHRDSFPEIPCERIENKCLILDVSSTKLEGDNG